ncbi:MTEF3-like protein [Mya arenaria]|uniref:MTEF3-like protein n=1 Tax=Mya arenaria TaxID=6604 RepID=A0ABY7ETP8_MYAAR|nr:MTEF3-like protein [Mya arenaria]
MYPNCHLKKVLNNMNTVKRLHCSATYCVHTSTILKEKASELKPSDLEQEKQNEKNGQFDDILDKAVQEAPKNLVLDWDLYDHDNKAMVSNHGEVTPAKVRSEIERWTAHQHKTMLQKVVDGNYLDKYGSIEEAHRSPEYVLQKNEELEETEKAKSLTNQRKMRLLALRQAIIMADKEVIGSSQNQQIVPTSESEGQECLELETTDKGLKLSEMPIKVAVPVLPNFLAIYAENKLLQQLVELGVDLSAVQKAGLANHVLNLDWRKQIKPLVINLLNRGLSIEQVGPVITQCPHLLTENLQNINVRLDYFLSKRFPRKVLTAMMLKDSTFLAMPVEKIDSILGFYQKLLNLTAVISLRNELEFSEEEVKLMFIKHPELLLARRRVVVTNCDYIQEVMGIPHRMVVQFPQALTGPHHIMSSRHRFLQLHGAAQYDSCLPGYVSLNDLVEKNDDLWCSSVAKASLEEYDAFLKMI